jgi:hypothetical protein
MHFELRAKDFLGYIATKRYNLVNVYSRKANLLKRYSIKLENTVELLIFKPV